MLDNNVVRREEPDGGHSYWSGKQQWPGITTVLGQLGYYGHGSTYYTADSRRKGHGVHNACRLADQLAPEARSIEQVKEVVELHPDLNLYTQNWLTIKQELRYTPLRWEVPVLCKDLMVAGTLDSCGYNNWGDFVLIDLKSWKNTGAKPSRASELQTAFYVSGAREAKLVDNGIRIRRYVIRLGGKGRVYLCDGSNDAMAMVYACHVWWDLAKHKLLPGQQAEEMEVAAIGE